MVKANFLNYICLPFAMLHRKVILKHFGGWANFVIWLACLVTAFYILDQHVFTNRRTTLLVNDLKKNSPELRKVIPDPTTPKPVYYECHITKRCSKEEYSYNIQSTTGGSGGVTICFNGIYIFNDMMANTKRGLNVVVVDETNGKVLESESFDTYTSDAKLITFLRKQRGTRLLLMATHDEASNGLGKEVKDLLHSYGTNLIDKLKFRDNYVMFGQRGLSHGSANEQFSSRESTSDFADIVSLTGCFKGPAIGKLDEKAADNVLNVAKSYKRQQPPIEPVKEQPKKEQPKKEEPKKEEIKKEIKKPAKPLPPVKLGEDLPNCGIPKKCDKNSFSAHLYTGKGNIDLPKMCINGKYIFANNLNDAGRGMNIAVVNPDTFEVARLGVFDLYAKDGNDLEIFLEILQPNEIVLVVINDDGSKHLTEMIWNEFDKLGASFLRKLVFRAGWLFVGQVGLKGHSIIEEVELPGAGNSFPNPIEKRICIPRKLLSSDTVKDMYEGKNKYKRTFCLKYTGYNIFCNEENIDKSTSPMPQTDDAYKSHDIYKVPIILIPGLNHISLCDQMQALITNKGLDPSMVHVVSHREEQYDLASVFQFKQINLTLDHLSTFKYTDLFNMAMHTAFSNKEFASKSIIFIEEEIMPLGDMLETMAQLLPTVLKDDSLAGITSWNDNGYQDSSSSPSKVYRTESMPGMAFLMKKDFYDKFIVNQLCKTCSNRTYVGWSFPGAPEMLVPDVSRARRERTSRLTADIALTTHLFNRPRTSSTGEKVKMDDIANLELNNYNNLITQEIKDGHILDPSNVKDCLEGHGLGFYIPHGPGKTHVIYFEQKKPDDYTLLRLLCSCFHLFSVNNYKPRGLHENTLRFTYQKNNMYLIGSKSKFYNLPPKASNFVKLSQLT